jgi:sporulation protein YlmC with PRC-barrel domain
MNGLKSILAASLMAISCSAPAMAQSYTFTTPDHYMRSSRLIGMTVYNEHNEKIGTIDDIMLPMGGGEIEAVLSVGGFLGIGQKMIKVPISHVHFAASQPMMEGDKAALMSMQRYTYGGGAN